MTRKPPPSRLIQYLVVHIYVLSKAAGLSNETIGEALDLKPSTVGRHFSLKAQPGRTIDGPDGYPGVDAYVTTMAALLDTTPQSLWSTALALWKDDPKGALLASRRREAAKVAKVYEHRTEAAAARRRAVG